MQTLGFVLMCWGGPYPVFVLAYCIGGFGMGLQVSVIELFQPGSVSFPGVLVLLFQQKARTRL